MMERRPFGPARVPVARIGQGTWDFPEGGARRKDAIEALQRGVELGMSHVDTAEMYGSGAVETLLGQALAPFDRAQLFITSKVLPSNATFEGTIAACERSLARLKMEYLDLYLLHWPGDHPLRQTMRALEELVRRGWVRSIGVSNFDLEPLKEACSYLTREAMACNQVLYHLRERAAEQLLFYCKQNEIAFVGYTPFGRSKFPQKEAQDAGVLGRIARARGKTPRQVILNFLTRQPHMFAIPKAASAAHVEENAGAAGWELDLAELDEIDAAFPVRDGAIDTL